VWNEKYAQIDYMFSAIKTQFEKDEELSPSQREKVMLKLIKPYLRLKAGEKPGKHYVRHFMNGPKVPEGSEYYFSRLYLSENNLVFGLKDIPSIDAMTPAFMLMVDVNGEKAPNTWGKDIYGLNIYIDGKIKALGYGNDILSLKKDCSPGGTGVFCSYYYRIGGDFNE